MIIGIDGRPLQEKYGGVKEFTLNMLHALFNIDQKNEYHIFYNSFNSPSVKGEREGFFAKYSNVHTHRFHWPNKLLNLSISLFNWPKLDKLIAYSLKLTTPLDLFCMPNLNFASFSPGFKYILTIHDLSFWHFPEFFPRKHSFWHKAIHLNKLLRQAEKIITVSEHSKNDIIETFNITPEKIEVIYPRVNMCHCEERNDEVVPEADPPWADNPDKTGLPRSPAKAGSLAMTDEYILYLGTLEPRKNIESIIEAYKILKTSPKYALSRVEGLPKLVIAGPKGWKYKTIFSAIDDSIRNDIIFKNQVSQEEKIALYQNAKIFIFPSFYEGFGLPPLEAASFGVPVIVSSASSLPEVLDDAAFYVNPWNITEIAEAMSLLLTNDELRQKLSLAGQAQAQKFQTNESAIKLLRLFEKTSKI